MATSARPQGAPALPPLGTLPGTLTPAEFRRVAAIAREQAGIDLREGKEALVAGRLAQRLRALRITTVRAYLDMLDTPAGRAEMPHLVDSLTTNKTNFFRESQHFAFM